MPVPAFRNSRSRVRRRRSHDAIKPIRITFDKDTGEAQLPHHEAPMAKRVTKESKKQKKVEKAPEVKTETAPDHDHAGHTHA